MTDRSEFSFSGHWAVLPPDPDPTETEEWLDALDAVIAHAGCDRATFLLRQLFDRARARRVALPPVWSTPYCNTIARADQPPINAPPVIREQPGDADQRRQTEQAKQDG